MNQPLAQIQLQKKQFWSDNFWTRVRSLEQLKHAFLIHARRIGLYSVNNSLTENFPVFKSVHLLYKYSDSVPNTHHAPEGGITNWFQAQHAPNGTPIPLGYPGIAGRINYYMEWYSALQHSCPNSFRLWDGSRFYTGTGGTGRFKPYTDDDELGIYHSDYSFQIFLSDWPGLQQSYIEAMAAREKAKTMYILANGSDLSDFKFDLDKWVNDKYPACNYI